MSSADAVGNEVSRGTPRCIHVSEVGPEHLAAFLVRLVTLPPTGTWHCNDVAPLLAKVRSLLPANPVASSSVWLISAVYLKRFVAALATQGMALVPKDSRPVAVACVMLASKYAIDGSPHCRSFARTSGLVVLQLFEARVLNALQWRLFVDDDDIAAALGDISPSSPASSAPLSALKY